MKLLIFVGFFGPWEALIAKDARLGLADFSRPSTTKIFALLESCNCEAAALNICRRHQWRLAGNLERFVCFLFLLSYEVRISSE